MSVHIRTIEQFTSADVLRSEGRGAAAEVDAWLMNGNTRLPSAGGIKTRVRFGVPYIFSVLIFGLF